MSYLLPDALGLTPEQETELLASIKRQEQVRRFAVAAALVSITASLWTMTGLKDIVKEAIIRRGKGKKRR